MSVPAVPQIGSYRSFVESVQLERIDTYLELNTPRSRFRGLGDLDLFAADRVLKQDYFQVVDAQKRVDYLLTNRESLLSHLEQHVSALERAMENEPQDVAKVLKDALDFTSGKVRSRLEQLRGELLLLERTHVLIDQHLRASMIEHHFDFAQADSYHITEYPKANTWFYSPLFSLYTAYFKQPSAKLLSEYIAKARELQASEHPLLGDSDFSRVFSLAPELRAKTALILDKLTTAELMSQLLID